MPKRRLPLLATTGDSDEPARPPWQWVGFGALAIFGIWVPLSACAAAIAARVLAHANDDKALRRAALVTSVIYALELATGALGGGYLVGRWGPANVGLREAALAGLAAAVVLTAVTWASFGPTPGLLLVGLMTPLMAAVGGRLGLRARARRP
jgi:peptidoglycan/LPS O-acetylase OafA/YrhL